MNPDAARDEAWRAIKSWETKRTIADTMWDARGRYDEQRIAELVEAAEALCRAYYNPDSLTPQPHLDALHVALRALGQSEEVKQ